MNFSGPGWTIVGVLIGLPLGFGIIVGVGYAFESLGRRRRRNG